MKYAVERASDADHDLDAIFDFLTESYQTFGDDEETAGERAAERLHKIHEAMEALGDAPHQGTVRAEISTGLRSVTKGRAVFYYDVDDERRRISVVAVFYGGQDHRRRMIKRILGS